LERGRFSDGRRVFTVRASSADAPDSFQVYTEGNPADIVMVVSGIISRNLKATWGDDWRSSSVEWRDWAKDEAFRVFYNGTESGGHGPIPRRIRFCDG
jgi:hypothetical protein